MTQRIYDHWQIAGKGRDPKMTVQSVARRDIERHAGEVYAERRARPGGGVRTDGVIIWGGHGHTTTKGLIDFQPGPSDEMERWRASLDESIQALPGRVVWYFGDPVTEPDPCQIRRAILDRARVGCDAVVFDHTAHEQPGASYLESAVEPWRRSLLFTWGHSLSLGVEPAPLPGGLSLDFSLFVAHDGVDSPWWRRMIHDRMAPTESHEVIAVLVGKDTGPDDWRTALQMGYSIGINAGGLGAARAAALDELRAEYVA